MESFKGAQGSLPRDTRITSHDFFRTFFQFCLILFWDFHFLHFGNQRVAKRYPWESISVNLGGTNGNLKIMLPVTRNHHFHGWRGSPETPEAFKKVLRKKGLEKTQKIWKNLENVFPKGPLWAAKGRPTNQLFHHFFDSAPLGVPWGSQGRQKTPKDTKIIQNDTKELQNETKVVKNEPQNNKQKKETSKSLNT